MSDVELIAKATTINGQSLQAVRLYELPCLVFGLETNLRFSASASHWPEVLPHDTFLVRLPYIESTAKSAHMCLYSVFARQI